MVHNIRNIVIAGAGVMGSSIARLFTAFGYQVALYDVKEEALKKSRELIRISQGAAQSSGKEILSSIRFTCEKNCFTTADFVIEAIVENLEIKHSFWSEVSKLVPAEAVLTSNTSGLSPTEIAEAVKGPERFCGMHWLNPPHICPLIEVVRGEQTAQATADLVCDLACDIGRHPVRLQKEVPGFLINRFQFAILREAMSLVEAGVAGKQDIDDVFKYGLGMRYACLGPFEIADLGGLDTFYRIASYLFADLCNTDGVSKLLAEPVKNGQYGVKSCRGFYDYSGGRDLEVIQKRDRDFRKVSECLYEAAPPK